MLLGKRYEINRIPGAFVERTYDGEHFVVWPNGRRDLLRTVPLSREMYAIIKRPFR